MSFTKPTTVRLRLQRINLLDENPTGSSSFCGALDPLTLQPVHDLTAMLNRWKKRYRRADGAIVGSVDDEGNSAGGTSLFDFLETELRGDYDDGPFRGSWLQCAEDSGDLLFQQNVCAAYTTVLNAEDNCYSEDGQKTARCSRHERDNLRIMNHNDACKEAMNYGRPAFHFNVNSVGWNRNPKVPFNDQGMPTSSDGPWVGDSCISMCRSYGMGTHKGGEDFCKEYCSTRRGQGLVDPCQRQGPRYRSCPNREPGALCYLDDDDTSVYESCDVPVRCNSEQPCAINMQCVKGKCRYHRLGSDCASRGPNGGCPTGKVCIDGLIDPGHKGEAMCQKRTDCATIGSVTCKNMNLECQDLDPIGSGFYCKSQEDAHKCIGKGKQVCPYECVDNLKHCQYKIECSSVGPEGCGAGKKCVNLKGGGFYCVSPAAPPAPSPAPAPAPARAPAPGPPPSPAPSPAPGPPPSPSPAPRHGHAPAPKHGHAPAPKHGHAPAPKHGHAPAPKHGHAPAPKHGHAPAPKHGHAPAPKHGHAPAPKHGHAPAPRHGHAPAPKHGHAPAPKHGHAPAPKHGHAPAPKHGHAPAPKHGHAPAPKHGHAPAPKHGHAPAPKHGHAPAPKHGHAPAPKHGHAPAPKHGHAPAPRHGHAPAPRHGHAPAPKHGHAPAPKHGHAPAPKHGHAPAPKHGHAPAPKHGHAPAPKHGHAPAPKHGHAPAPKHGHAPAPKHGHAPAPKHGHAPAPKHGHAPAPKHGHAPAPKHGHAPAPKHGHAPAPKHGHAPAPRHGHAPAPKHGHAPAPKHGHAPAPKHGHAPAPRHGHAPAPKHGHAPAPRHGHAPAPKHGHAPAPPGPPRPAPGLARVAKCIKEVQKLTEAHHPFDCEKFPPCCPTPFKDFKKTLAGKYDDRDWVKGTCTDFFSIPPHGLGRCYSDPTKLYPNCKKNNDNCKN